MGRGALACALGINEIKLNRDVERRRPRLRSYLGWDERANYLSLSEVDHLDLIRQLFYPIISIVCSRFAPKTKKPPAWMASNISRNSYGTGQGPRKPGVPDRRDFRLMGWKFGDFGNRSKLKAKSQKLRAKS